jgi:predicted GNAT family acetyltransferase
VADAVDARLGTHGLIWLWEMDSEPVSMAWLTPPVGGVSRVSGVYTPSDLRGHGYASACVARISEHALATGSRLCMLYTDLANPISNKIYQRIGYRPVADAQEWFFTAAG